MNPKSILKTTKQADKHVIPSGRVKSPSLPLKGLSRSVAEKLAQDDAEIAALEKKLGLRGRKSLPRAFKEDALDELLDGLYEGSGSNIPNEERRRTDEGEWLAQKRKQARNSPNSKYKEEDERGEEEGETSSRKGNSESVTSEASPNGGTQPGDEKDGIITEGEDKFMSDSEDDFTSFGSESSMKLSSTPPTRVRENPYVAPTSAGNRIPAKYIPPSLRKVSPSESEALDQLRRQIQGLINRLTEANLLSILGDIEKLYQHNARQHVTSTIVDLLLTSVCDPTSLPDTLIILPAGFIAAIYKIIGTDFGAHFIQRAVELFDVHYFRATKPNDNRSAAVIADIGKETSNLIALLAELFNFQVVGSNLIFDYVRCFLDTLSELNTELLLKIIRMSGPQLRQEDPSSLKDIVKILRPAVTKLGEQNISVRTRFMIEMIDDLKNNRVKTGVSASAVTSEHIIRMKRTLGTLNARNIKASEPLRIGLKDIRESDKEGKWWLVGASWAGNETRRNDRQEPLVLASSNASSRTVNVAEAEVSDLVGLAREQRMNTDIRRAIFITVMSASDYEDAHLRLIKLKLKKAQELEIPKVLIHCSSAENTYNPYYTLIAKKLCGDRKLKVAFRFSLWDIFRELGERGDDDATEDNDDKKALDTRQLVNLAKMFGSLIAGSSLTLSALKYLQFRCLQPKTKIFVEVLLITVLLQSQADVEDRRDKNSVANIILNVKDAPHIAEGLHYFMKRVVSKTDIAGGAAEKATIRWGCKIATGILQDIATENAGKT
jgi:nucleolar MIF4G domain-containing protein 1